jgi:hypothetical protein
MVRPFQCGFGEGVGISLGGGKSGNPCERLYGVVRVAEG